MWNLKSQFLCNFHEIEVEDLTKHKMDSEQMIISKEACELVNKTKQEGHHVCAIGTSVMKATETAVGTDGMMKEFDGWTNKFIFPPYDFGLVDGEYAFTTGDMTEKDFADKASKINVINRIRL